MYCVFLRICDVAALLCSLLQYSNVIHLHLHDPNSLFMFDAIFRLLLYFSLLVGGWLCVDWFYEIDVCCGAFGLHCDMRVTDALHSGTRTWLANFASISIRHKRASLLYELKSIHTHDALDPLPISPPEWRGVCCKQSQTEPSHEMCTQTAYIMGWMRSDLGRYAGTKVSRIVVAAACAENGASIAMCRGDCVTLLGRSPHQRSGIYLSKKINGHGWPSTHSWIINNIFYISHVCLLYGWMYSIPKMPTDEMTSA